LKQDMTDRNQGPAQIITSPAGLERLVDEYRREEVVAFDLEADSMHHYREKVCLIQVATSSRVFLVDPLNLSDISPLAKLLGDPSIRKVFHGADYDVRSMRRDFSVGIDNLFDTMIACQFLGEKEVGLAAVLRKRFGVELDKRFQKADWSKRPLAPDMIAYAIADTSLLVPLYRQLEDELRVKGRLSWVEEESELVSRATAADRKEEPLFCRFKGAHRMDPRTLAVLEELLRLRDKKAEMYDLPPFKILSHDTLSTLAEKKPCTQAELFDIHGLSAKLIARHGGEILKAVSIGIGLPASRLPRYPQSQRPKKDKQKMEICRRLKLWRESKALELGMDAGSIANNNLLDALADAVPRDMGELDSIKTLRKWQKREFGEELLMVVKAAATVA
jgi:ribonuclease D